LTLIGRDNEFLVPSGSTVLQAEDRLFLLSAPETLAQVKQMMKPD
jgi:Trk K+ transport system NAD-binding subunit